MSKLNPYGFRTLSIILCLSFLSFEAGAQRPGPNNRVAAPMPGTLPAGDGSLQRITIADRDLIRQPAPGLLIYQTDGAEGVYINKGNAATPSWQLLPLSIASGYGFLYYTGFQNVQTNFTKVMFKNFGPASNTQPTGVGIVALKTGVYRVSWNLSVKNKSNAARDIIQRVKINGMDAGRFAATVQAGGTTPVSNSIVIPVNAGDIISVETKCLTTDLTIDAPEESISATMEVMELR